MIEYRTRFNPTVNSTPEKGLLHLGHLYNYLVNYHEAKRSGGKFGIRFDNIQRVWCYLFSPDDIAGCIQETKDLLEWLGVVPDWYHEESEMLPQAKGLLEHHFKFTPDVDRWDCGPTAEVVGLQQHWYPLASHVTTDTVVFDSMDGINWLIVGYDLLTRDNLYRYLCDKFTLTAPRMTYIPRLKFGGDEVSKTNGLYKLKDYRAAGISPKELLDNLAMDCLKDCCDSNPQDWRVDNIKDVADAGTVGERGVEMTDKIDYSTIEYNFQKYCVGMMLTDEFLSQIDAPQVKMVEHVFNNLMNTLFTFQIAQRKLQEYKWPATWRDVFKERWFPAWLRKKYPVRYCGIDILELIAANRQSSALGRSLRYAITDTHFTRDEI